MPTDIETLTRYGTDKKFRIETFYWVVNKESKKVPLIANPPQTKYLADKSKNKLILKARKEGFSTMIEADFLDECLNTQNVRAVTMAHTQDDAKIHMDRIQYMIDTMGSSSEKIKINLDTETQKELYFPDTNSYYWIGTAGSKSFGRGRDITHLHLSEVSHYEDQTVLTSVFEACTPNARKILETTANGIGEKFQILWEEAHDPATGSSWKPMFFAWFEDPTNVLECPEGFQFQERYKAIRKEYNLSLNQIYWYYRKYCDSADKTLFAQEHPCNAREAFISSGQHIFNLDRLDVMLNDCLEPLYIGDLEDDGAEIKFVSNPDGALRIWKLFKPNRSYLIACDTSEGVTDGAFNVATVYDRGTWEVVAELRLRCDPFLFGKKIDILGEFYNWAVLAPELNNTGHATMAALKESEYPHIFNMKQINDDMPDKQGFITDGKTKEIIISAVRNAVDEGNYKENSPVAIREMQRAVRNEQGRMVSQGKKSERLNLDCIITRGIGLYLLKFLTLDETYRDSQPHSVNSEHSLSRRKEVTNRKSRTGYR